MTALRDVLPAMIASDSSRPRLTAYDGDERIELSARVLNNWAMKAANLLQEDLDIEADDTVCVDLPGHWRGAYWCLAAWHLGARVTFDRRPADAVITDDAARAAASSGPTVLVSLPALSREHPQADTAPRAVDEAKEIAGYEDDCLPFADPEDDPEAQVVEGHGRETRAVLGGPLAQVMPQMMSVWAADGSVVLVRGEVSDATLATERFTDDLRD